MDIRAWLAGSLCLWGGQCTAACRDVPRVFQLITSRTSPQRPRGFAALSRMHQTGNP